VGLHVVLQRRDGRQCGVSCCVCGGPMVVMAEVWSWDDRKEKMKEVKTSSVVKLLKCP